MNFDSLIGRYSQDVEVLVPNGGTRDEAGRYIENPRQAIQMRAAIVNIPETKRDELGGHITNKDLYMYVPGSLIGQNLKVRFGEDEYNVEATNDHSTFAGFTKYLLKWSSIRRRV